MPLLSATNLRYAIGQEVILDGVSLSIEAGERVGLVGRNGGGKTTLMRAMAGQLKPDTGEVNLQRGARAGYLSQEPSLEPSRTLREEAGTAFAELERLHEVLVDLFHRMEHLGSGGDGELDRLLKQQMELEKKIEAAGGYAVEHRIEAVLHGLGFADSQFGVKVKDLSGGQKGRLALGKLLLESPDVVMLDEPTNHLDISGREWLEEFLVGEFRGAVVMVSHDRYMLDRVVHRIIEVERMVGMGGRLIEYPGNYSAFREIRAERRLTQRRAFEKQQDKFKKEQAFIDRYRAGQRAKQAQGRETRLEREKRDLTLERPMELETFRFALPKAPRSGDLTVIVRGAGKWYRNQRVSGAGSGVGSDGSPEDRAAPSGSPESPTALPDTRNPTPDPPIRPGTPGAKVLFHNFDVTISRGERWGVIGPNGAGKTTLVRGMLGQIPLNEGTAKLGANVVVGYFSQQPDEADPALAVWQYLQLAIRRENPSAAQMSEQAARDLAGAFLFAGRDQEKPLGVLSGGERGRARLAALLASAKNLLILDEPTNHLDIPSAERLEDVMRKPGEDGEEGGGYEGTFILISHDRALIDATCEHLLVLDGEGNVEVFHGNYTQWHERQERRRKEEAAARVDEERKREAAERRKREAAAPAKPSDGGVKNGAAKKGHGGSAGGEGSGGGGGAKKAGGLAWMPMERLEAEIESVTKKVKEAERLLGDAEVYRDRDRFNALLAEQEKGGAELARLEEEWLRRAGG